MSERSDRRYCAECRRHVLATSHKPNHTLHLLLTIFTCSLWGIVWLCIALVGSPYRCSRCGERV